MAFSPKFCVMCVFRKSLSKQKTATTKRPEAFVNTNQTLVNFEYFFAAKKFYELALLSSGGKGPKVLGFCT